MNEYDKDPLPQTEAAASEEAPNTIPASDADRSAALEQELAETKDRLLRALAETENLRKRTERDVADARLYGISNFARDILGIADNMQRALQAVDGELRNEVDDTTKVLLEGVELTERELMNVLEKMA